MLSSFPQYNGIVTVEGELLLSKKLLLLAMLISFCLILLPALLVRGCTWGFDEPRPEASHLEPAIPIQVYIEEEQELVTMDLEEYVKGVIMAEMPASFHLEALKAQAVAARTYAVLRMRVFGGEGCEHHPPADITANSDHAQAFASAASMSWGFQTARYTALVEQAVRHTEGIIATHDDYPIDAVYHSTCGGHTEAAGDVWQEDIPYLVGVECGHCSHSRHYRTRQTFLVEEAARLLHPGSTGAKNPLFEVAEFSPTGRARTVSTAQEVMRGLDFRLKLGLPSTHFSYEVKGDTIHFELRGWGHGVGMCQYGADGMARSGHGFLEILAHYYPGTVIRPIFQE